MATRLNKLSPGSFSSVDDQNTGGEVENCTRVDNKSVQLVVADLDKIFFRLKHRINRLRREHPQLNLQPIETALSECSETAKSLTSFWSWFSTKQAHKLKAKYESLIDALTRTAYTDIGTNEQECNAISGFVVDITESLVQFSEKIFWLTTGTICGGIVVASGSAILEWMFGMARFIFYRAPAFAVNYVAKWLVLMGMTAGGAYALSSILLACVAAGVCWVTFKVIIIPLVGYFYLAIEER